MIGASCVMTRTWGFENLPSIDPFTDEIPCWHADSDRLNEIPELFTVRQMEQH